MLAKSMLQSVEIFYSLNFDKIMGSSNNPLLNQKIKNNLTQSVEDKVLWQSFKKGNELAFSGLYKRYVNKLFNYGMHLCFKKEIVSDTIQELYTNLWARRGQLADVEVVNYYLFKSFRNLLLQKINQKENSFLHLDHAKDFVETDLTYEESLIIEQTNEQQTKQLQFALKALTKRQHELVLLKFYNELSYGEVASVMEISVESAHNLLSKAVHTLRDHLVSFIKKKPRVGAIVLTSILGQIGFGCSV
ncbi:MAG: sigma-70 family RNA polymerase sigma factor [Cyclobacteriaceae bacterium]|nr:sigma-70 family RNA polymerase sigma factor [Cyclobacteriaceae bacterium]